MQKVGVLNRVKRRVQFLVIRWIRSGNLTCNVMTIVNNSILYN